MRTTHKSSPLIRGFGMNWNRKKLGYRRFFRNFWLGYIEDFFECVLQNLAEIHARFFGFAVEPCGNRAVLFDSSVVKLSSPFISVGKHKGDDTVGFDGAAVACRWYRQFFIFIMNEHHFKAIFSHFKSICHVIAIGKTAFDVRKTDFNFSFFSSFKNCGISVFHRDLQNKRGLLPAADLEKSGFFQNLSGKTFRNIARVSWNWYDLTRRTYSMVMARAMSERPASLTELALKFKFGHSVLHDFNIIRIYAYCQVKKNKNPYFYIKNHTKREVA